MNELAILGGTPVRTKPWLVEPMVDDEEERLVLEAVRQKNFSRYIGSSAPDIETTLRMTSAEALAVQDYWHFLGGPNVRRFAAEFAEKLKVPYAVPVNSATSGLSVALAASGVEAGDEVILPALSYSASGTAPLLFGAIPVFVDVDPHTFCMDPAAVRAAITPRTKAILPVHLTGNMADMGALLVLAEEFGLRVIEDAAQAIGASWGNRAAGTLGTAGVFSFQQSKNIMTGEGGMIVTHDPEVARRARLIINHGETVMEDDDDVAALSNMVGCNFRLPELCAAVGVAQLAKLDKVNAWRTRNADVLRQELSNLPGIEVPLSQRLDPGTPAQDVPHLFVALFDASTFGCGREIFVAALRAEGIPVGTGYLRPMYANPMFLKRIAFGREGYPWSAFPEAGQACAKGMCPVSESLLYERFLWFYHIAYASTEDDMRQIGAAVRKVVDNRARLADMDPATLGKLSARAQGRIGT